MEIGILSPSLLRGRYFALLRKDLHLFFTLKSEKLSPGKVKFLLSLGFAMGIGFSIIDVIQESLTSMKIDMKFDETNMKFDETNMKFDETNMKIDSVNATLGVLGAQLDTLGAQLDKVLQILNPNKDI
jgi:hypothetical protein